MEEGLAGLPLRCCPTGREKGHGSGGPSACPASQSGTSLYMRLPAPGNAAELGTALTLEGLHNPLGPMAPPVHKVAMIFPIVSLSAEEVSQRPASSLNAELSCRSRPDCRGY